ncbi:hypothetical protein, partial [Staphylococcus gallinarum]|uniref:hypothetical protein n=1 Tax=Staphylococcus gallinarum TaxID=1293 RepID=UPI001F541D4F
MLNEFSKAPWDDFNKITANITGTTTRIKDRNIKKYLKNLFMFEAPHAYDLYILLYFSESYSS